MSRVIYKYPLSIVDRQQVLMPAGAKLLSVQFQRSTLCVWALVDSNDGGPLDFTLMAFTIIGTGNEIGSGDIGSFLGTVQQFGGQLIWHVFASMEGAGA